MEFHANTFEEIAEMNKRHGIEIFKEKEFIALPEG